MSSGFAPSVDSAVAQGIRVVRQEYPPGIAGVKLSLEQIAMRIREGRLDPAVRGWAGDQLIAAGRPEGSRNQSVALLGAVRKVTVYAHDPVRAEYNVGAAGTLCLRPNLCVRAADCDDGVIALGAVLMSVGIPARILKQTFGSADQEHVLVEAQDENGNWFPLDPSTDIPAGQKAPATSEVRIDPMNPEEIGLVGAPEAEFIGVGAIPRGLGVHFRPTPRVAAMAPIQLAAIGMGAPRRPEAVGMGLTAIAEVNSLDTQVDAEFNALDVIIRGCPQLPPTDLLEWNGLLQSWKALDKYWRALSYAPWYEEPSASLAAAWVASDTLAKMTAFQQTLLVWQQRVARQCTGYNPPPAPPVPVLPPPGSDFGSQVTTAAKAITGVAVAGLVVYAAYEGLKWLDVLRPERKARE